MADDNDLERTEQATPRRLEQAREEGQVARSQELTTFALMTAAGGGLWWTGGDLFEHMRALMGAALRIDVAGAFDPTAMGTRLQTLSLEALLAFAPLLIVLLLVAFGAPQLLSGWLFTANALRFDLERINPLAGIGRIASWRGVAELCKALAKSLLIGVVAAAVIWHFRVELLRLTSLPLEAGVAELGRIAGLSFLTCAGALAVIAAADVPFQLWRHADDLKMSREDLRQEMKESEGDPQIKAQIRAQQRAIAKRRMMAAVPKADVIVTNPTHYAVALSYEESMRAPRVVAKGTDLVAARIREIGAEHGVPVLESPALARAIWRHAEIGDEIPHQLYTAVAQVLAYVFQLKAWREYGGLAPRPLEAIAVPPGLDPQEARS